MFCNTSSSLLGGTHTHTHVRARTHTRRTTPGRQAGWSLSAAPHYLACITSENTGWQHDQHISSISVNTTCRVGSGCTAQQCGAVLCHVVLRGSCAACSRNLAALGGAKRPLYEAAGESVLRGLAATETLRRPRGTRESGGRDEPPHHHRAFNDLMGNGDDLNDEASVHICRPALCTQHIQH